jgi:PAS domain S-box-containing protein
MKDDLKNKVSLERDFLMNKIKEIQESIGKGGNSNLDILKFILENTTDGYWDWHISKDYEYLSPTFKSQLGYEDHEMENHPSSWQKLANEEDLKRIFALVTKHFETKGEVPVLETIRFTHKKGYELTILCRGKVVEWGENGEPIRMVGTHAIIEENK